MKKDDPYLCGSLCAVRAAATSALTPVWRPVWWSKRLARGFLVYMLLAAVAQLVSGCAVIMAMEGDKGPDLTKLKVGTARSDIERELGAPESTKPLGNGRSESVYGYGLGRKPSVARGLVYLWVDLNTLGLFELVGTIVESDLGEKQESAINYDAKGIVRSIETFKLEKDSDGNPVKTKVKPEGKIAQGG